MQKLALRQVDETQRKVEHLRRMERALKEMAAQCSNEAVPKCPVIEILSATSSSRI